MQQLKWDTPNPKPARAPVLPVLPELAAAGSPEGFTPLSMATFSWQREDALGKKTAQTKKAEQDFTLQNENFHCFILDCSCLQKYSCEYTNVPIEAKYFF